MTKNKNRRVFFRIFDEVNLFYKKIDEKRATELNPVSDQNFNDLSWSTDTKPELPLPRLKKNLPDLKGNESRHVSISASGMAFVCEDALKEGDYLAMKIFLAPSMKTIVTYGKVVYCKSSQLNDSRYPYFSGIRFVNMEGEDRELLTRHVEKKRLKQRRLDVFILAVVIMVIAAPAMVFGFLFELSHFLLELFLESSHLTFEFIEENLDHLIEHLFDTDLHQTQIIVFYILAPIIFYGFYRLWRVFPSFCRRHKRNMSVYWSWKKASMLFYWREQSLFNKIKLIVMCAVAVFGSIFLGM